MAHVQSTYLSRQSGARRSFQTTAGYLVFGLSFGFAIAVVFGLIA